MIKKIILIGVLGTALSSQAQQKMLSMEDAVVNQYRSLAPDRLSQLQWMHNASAYTYVDSKANLLMKGDLKGEENMIISLENLNQQLLDLGEQKCKSFPHIIWDNSNQFSFELSKKIFSYQLDNAKLSLVDSLELPANATNRDKSSKGDIAFTVDHNLYLLHGDVVKPVSVNSDKDMVSGQSVSRNEFGINKGTFWSPDGSKLAYYVKDESRVSDYPIVDWTTDPASVSYIKYPMAGSPNTELVELWVYDLNSATSKKIKTESEVGNYLTSIGWGPDSKTVYIAHLNRGQDHMLLKSYDASSGEMLKTLIEEKSDKYVEPEQAPHFVKGQDDLFIWESSRDGFNHLYLYNTKGKLLRQLTKGNWTVTSFDGFDAEGKYAYFTSTAESPLNRDLYRVPLKGGTVERLTNGSGTHMTDLHPDGSYFIDQFSNVDTPWETAIYASGKGIIKEIQKSDNPLSEYNLGEMRLLSLDDGKGGKLYSRMILPIDFDSTKTYPVVVYLYGGPHAQMVRNYWNGGGNLWFQYMAQQGYIVWTLDNHGSGNRGRAWEQQTFGQLGTVEMEDQMRGIEFLKSKPYVDSSRMGIHGWSFGGFMTMSMMSRNPGVFKAGVAGGPVIDWSMYEVMYTERYMNSPEENPEGYKNSNLLNHIDELEGKLLIIHGTSDPVVVWQHTQKYLKKAVESNKQVDYFVYPMHEHNVRGYDRIHLMQKVTDYFNDFVK